MEKQWFDAQNRKL
jgi:hypothetical protein